MYIYTQTSITFIPVDKDHRLKLTNTNSSEVYLSNIECNKCQYKKLKLLY